MNKQSSPVLFVLSLILGVATFVCAVGWQQERQLRLKERGTVLSDKELPRDRLIRFNPDLPYIRWNDSNGYTRFYEMPTIKETRLLKNIYRYKNEPLQMNGQTNIHHLVAGDGKVQTIADLDQAALEHGQDLLSPGEPAANYLYCSTDGQVVEYRIYPGLVNDTE